MKFVEDVDVVAALTEPELVPPPPDGDWSGSTSTLRASMARFAAPEAHRHPRDAVEALLVDIDPSNVAAAARECTARRLGTSTVDVARSIASVVPVETMLRVLNLESGRVEDVDAVVGVIGRGSSPTDRSDAAADRLLALAAKRGHDPVAAVSTLYQTMDATAALILCRLHAVATGTEPVAAVPRTRRVARTGVVVAGRRVDRGTEVVVELSTRPFGAGAHECPGRDIAEALADAVVDTIIAASYVVDLPGVEFDHDGRPQRLRVVAADAPDT